MPWSGMGVKGLRYQDTTKIDNRINSKLSYQQCSGRQEKSFQDYYLCLFIEFVLRRECPGQNLEIPSNPSKAGIHHSCGEWTVDGEGKSLLSLRTMRGKGL